MKRLRISNTFGVRNQKSESRIPKDVYVISIASEGKTEELYFENLSTITKSIIKIERLEKSDEFATHSHPNHIFKLLDERMERWKEYGVKSDELWMVIDRDKQNVSEEQILKIIESCQNNNYNLALSNPTFELWLLLHLSDLTEYIQEDLLNNHKISKNKRFIESELSKLIGFTKTNIKFDKLKQGINIAIQRAKNLNDDNSKLVDKLGSSVNKLVNRIYS